jgi:hemolysin III
MTSLTGSFRLAEIHGVPETVSVTESITNFASAVRAKSARKTAGALPGAEAVEQVRKALTRPAVPTRSFVEELAEERLNAVTHGIGLLASFGAFAWLLATVIESGGAVRIAACGIYGVSLMLMYAGSTALHSAIRPKWKLRFQVCDHVAIYLLIAGTYTPFLAAALHNRLGWILLGCVWALAGIGIAAKLRFATRLDDTSPLPYIGLGWLALAILEPLFEVMPGAGLWLLVAGGVAYSIGVPFFCRDDKRYFHAIWHLFVIAGTGCHFAAVLLYIAR